MLVAPTVDARNLAEISINCMANCGLCWLQMAIKLLQCKNIAKLMYDSRQFLHKHEDLLKY
jgi:hypothetical protein